MHADTRAYLTARRDEAIANRETNLYHETNHREGREVDERVIADLNAILDAPEPTA